MKTREVSSYEVEICCSLQTIIRNYITGKESAKRCFEIIERLPIEDDQERVQGIRQGVLLYFGTVCNIIYERTPRPIGEIMDI